MTAGTEALELIERRYSCLGLAQLRSDGTLFADCIFPRRGGRAVDRAGLENRKAERSREFESHPLRALSPILTFARTLRFLTSAVLLCSVNSDQ